MKENVALGIEEESINIQKVNDCISQVQLENLISTLPNGLETIIGENGIKFSGGETQRLSIARALYVAPDIIVLDEPTNSLDEKTEKKIMEILKNLSKNHTIILVTHNLANINFCDKIIELGKHEVNIKKIERNQ